MIQPNPFGILFASSFIVAMGLLFLWMFRVPPAVPLSVARVHRSIEAVRKILVPLIEAMPSERAVELACRFGNGKKAELVLVHVMEIPYTLPLSAPMPEREKSAHDALEIGALIGQRYGCQVQTRLIRHRNAADSILEIAQKENVDAILLGVGLKSRIPGEWGKTGAEILRRASCEVIVDKVPLAARPVGWGLSVKPTPSA